MDFRKNDFSIIFEFKINIHINLFPKINNFRKYSSSVK